MTTEQLEQMLAAATPGPWTVDAKDPSDVVVWASESELIGNIGHRVQPITVIFDMDEANARLIAAAPTITAELIAARRKLEAAENLAHEMRGLAYAYVNLCEMTGKTFHKQSGSKYTASMAALAAWKAAQ